VQDEHFAAHRLAVQSPHQGNILCRHGLPVGSRHPIHLRPGGDVPQGLVGRDAQNAPRCPVHANELSRRAVDEQSIGHRVDGRIELCRPPLHLLQQALALFLQNTHARDVRERDDCTEDAAVAPADRRRTERNPDGLPIARATGQQHGALNRSPAKGPGRWQFLHRNRFPLGRFKAQQSHPLGERQHPLLREVAEHLVGSPVHAHDFAAWPVDDKAVRHGRDGAIQLGGAALGLPAGGLGLPVEARVLDGQACPPPQFLSQCQIARPVAAGRLGDQQHQRPQRTLAPKQGDGDDRPRAHPAGHLKVLVALRQAM
jgi:hypothetical protein